MLIFENSPNVSDAQHIHYLPILFFELLLNRLTHYLGEGFCAVKFSS